MGDDRWSIAALRDVSSLTASNALKEELNGTGAVLPYLYDGSDTTIYRHTHETNDNRTRNCFSSPKYVRICGRHEELQHSRRTPRRSRRPSGNQAQEPFRKHARSDRA